MSLADHHNIIDEGPNQHQTKGAGISRPLSCDGVYA